MGRFPKARKNSHFHTIISVRIDQGAEVTVSGFGVKYHNPDEPQMEAWLNKNEPIAGGVTLTDLIWGSTFYFLVQEMDGPVKKNWDESTLAPPSNNLQFGTEHPFDIDCYGNAEQRDSRTGDPRVTSGALYSSSWAPAAPPGQGPPPTRGASTLPSPGRGSPSSLSETCPWWDK